MLTEFALTGRKALITGAASGVGAATARAFAKAGATLVLADISLEPTQRLAAELGASAVAMNVRSEKSVDDAVAEASRILGGLDAIVNAAGVAAMTTLEETTLESWERQIETNLTGVFLVCRAAAPHLRAADAATIVTVASATGLMPSIAGAAYGASKAGAIMLCKALARELGPSIRVNSVCPGIIDTPMFADLVPVKTAEFEQKLKTDYVMGRLAKADEIANAILFLSSDASSFITGTAMAVDGGRVFH